MIGRFRSIIKIMWGFLKYHKKHALLCILLISIEAIVLGGTLTLLLPIITQVFSPDFISQNGESGYFGKIIGVYFDFLEDSDNKELVSIGVLFILMLVNSSLRFIIIVVNAGLTTKITCDCRELIYASILQLPFQEFVHQKRGMYVQLLITEARSVYAVFKQLLSMIGTAVNTGVILLLLILLSWKLSLTLFSFYIVTLWISFFITRDIKKKAKKALVLRSELTNQATESILGLKQLKLNQAEAYMRQKLNQASIRSENLAKLITIRNGLLPLSTQNFLLIGVLVLVVMWWFFTVFSNAIPQTAGFITFLIIVSKLFQVVGKISTQYGSILSNIPAIFKVRDYIDRGFTAVHNGIKEPKPFFRDAIILQDIHFEYNSGVPILKNLSLKVDKGAYIGIIGASGGGKSTIFDLLLKFYQPTRGIISIDGIDLQEIRSSYVRTNIGLVSQNFFLFNLTVKENMQIARPTATEEDLWKALEKAGLRSFIENHDMRFNMPVGNNGENLSGGQRQRLSLAIVFLCEPEVIILDEGTSSVDAETEKHILFSLREMHLQGKTIISSAHKESALIDADIIYEQIDGRLRKVR